MTIWLIGNGFDLALGYKTSFLDFIKWCKTKLKTNDAKIIGIASKDKREKLIHFISYYEAWCKIKEEASENKYNSIPSEWNKIESSLVPMFQYVEKEFKNKELIKYANEFQRLINTDCCKSVGKIKVPLNRIKMGFLYLLQMLQAYYLGNAYKAQVIKNNDLWRKFIKKLNQNDIICSFNFTNTLKNVEKYIKDEVLYIHYITEMLSFIEGISKRKRKKSNKMIDIVQNEFMIFDNENNRMNTYIETKLTKKVRQNVYLQTRNRQPNRLKEIVRDLDYKKDTEEEEEEQFYEIPPVPLFSTQPKNNIKVEKWSFCLPQLLPYYLNILKNKEARIESYLATEAESPQIESNKDENKQFIPQLPQKWIQVVLLGNSFINDNGTNKKDVEIINKYDNEYIAYKNTWKKARDTLFLWLHQNHMKKEDKDKSKELLFEVFGFSFGESDDVFIKEIMLELINTHLEYAELLKQEPNIRIRFNLYEHNGELEEEIGNIKERLKLKIQERFPKLEVKFQYLFWK